MSVPGGGLVGCGSLVKVNQSHIKTPQVVIEG